MIIIRIHRACKLSVSAFVPAEDINIYPHVLHVLFSKHYPNRKSYFYHILKILHYLEKEGRLEVLSSPSHIGSWTSCHVTRKCQVASFLSFGFGGNNRHLGQTWEQQRRDGMSTERRARVANVMIRPSAAQRNKHRAKNSLRCFLATRCSYCMWLKQQCWAHFFPCISLHLLVERH